jgi:FtsZ-binding cell division protein ZapB
MSADSSVMPKLDAFDDEFGRERPDIVGDPKPNTGFRLSTLIGLALAAGVISALALGWPNTSGPSRSELQSESAAIPNSGEKRENLDAAVNRLAREVEALKTENKELRQAQQQAANTIAALQGGEQDSRGSFVAWYSDLTALTFGIASQSEGGATGRRSAIARPKPREVLRRDDGGPISLEPPQ